MTTLASTDIAAPTSTGRRRPRLNPRITISGGFLAIVAITAIFAPLIAPHSYGDMVGRPLAGLGLLGTDDYGRDIFSRLIYAGRVSLSVSVAAVLIAGVVGTALGLVAGYVRGWTETVIMRGIDVMLSFPTIVLAVAAVAALGSGLSILVGVIGVLYIPRFARVVYGSALSVRANDYVLAARAMGAGPVRIMAGTILPNILAPIVVQASLSLSFAIQVESGLSFLGLGAQPPLPSWGSMVSAGRDFLAVQPVLLIAPALVIAAVVLALNVLGDGLRDSLDPQRTTKTKKKGNA
ncbi:ABC transporter permease [Fodinicola acaciae]|uniref:ABC transporter permease n=1 Tax=Fodinicola acaciae TaxID=2681555 RepID=UPI0013D799BC|nr:ABC transporter permease [Fodinicola acaciae]